MVVNFLRQFLRVLILSLDHQFGYVFVPNVLKMNVAPLSVKMSRLTIV